MNGLRSGSVAQHASSAARPQQLSNRPESRLESILDEHLGAGHAARITEMPGGASTRRYFRVASGATRLVAMYVPDADQSDEIARPESRPQWPFLEVRDALAMRGVRVPEVPKLACESGFVLVEDLGDATLADYLLDEPGAKARLYERAVRDLAVAQQRLADLPPDSVVRSRAFDFDLLCWEVDHFVEWGLGARDIDLGPAASEFRDACGALCRRIDALPKGFVHRDYQSRNLMVLDGTELAWIDFQDALLGPRAYDLVALLCDSYQDLTRKFIDSRIDDYADELGLSDTERETLGEEFDWITVQRKLKDAGRFVYIDRVRKDPSFLGFVEPTLDRVFDALDRLQAVPEFGTIRSILGPLLRPTGRGR